MENKTCTNQSLKLKALLTMKQNSDDSLNLHFGSNFCQTVHTKFTVFIISKTSLIFKHSTYQGQIFGTNDMQ